MRTLGELIWPSKKENKKLTARRKKKKKTQTILGENRKNKPYLKRRLLDHLGFISRLQVCLAFSSSSSLHPIYLQSLPLFKSPSLPPEPFYLKQKTVLRSPSLLSLHLSRALSFPFPSLHLKIAPAPFASTLHPKTAPTPAPCFLIFFFI